MEKIYTGYLKEDSWGDADDILYLDDEVLVEILEGDLVGKEVSISYYICEGKCTIDEAMQSFIKTLNGELETAVGARYSEVTGYLWIDEEINIGGHNLILELHNYIGKYLILRCLF